MVTQGASLNQNKTYSSVMVMVHRVQMPLEELVLCRNQHVTGHAVCGFNLLEEMLLANPWNGTHKQVSSSFPARSTLSPVHPLRDIPAGDLPHCAHTSSFQLPTLVVSHGSDERLCSFVVSLYPGLLPTPCFSHRTWLHILGSPRLVLHCIFFF